MVGRSSQGNPFIFRQIKEYLEKGEITYFPTAIEKLETALLHIDNLCKEKGESRGIKEARKHVAWYIKGMPHSNELKTKVFTVTELSEMSKLLRFAIDNMEK